MKKLNTLLLVGLMAISMSGCNGVKFSDIVSKTPPPTPEQINAKVTAIAAQMPNDVQLILVPVLVKNRAYVPLVKAIGEQLPGILESNGAVSPATITAGLAKIAASVPGVPASVQTDLSWISVGLSAALDSYSAASGNSIVLYTDPNVKVLIDAFSGALVSSANGVQVVFPTPAASN